MVDIRCYRITEGVFEGNVVDMWVQIFIKDNYEDEFDMDSNLYFMDMDIKIGNIPIFSSNEEFNEKYIREIELWDDLEQMITKHAPSIILLTEHDLFKEIVKDSTQEQISSVEIAILKERKMAYYAMFKCNYGKVMLVAM